jgi:hypothetical protein
LLKLSDLVERLRGEPGAESVKTIVC